MNDITERTLEAYSRIKNPRIRSLVTILIKHLHACVQEMQLTDQEYEFTWNFLERMAAFTGPERNEFLLFADVTGISQLVEIVNHDKPGQEVGFALVGPFFRAGTPFRERAS